MDIRAHDLPLLVSLKAMLDEKNITRAAARLGVSQPALSAQHYSVVPLLLQSTDLVCTLPQRFLSRYHDVLQALRLPFDTRPFTLHATWHARFDNDRGHQWLRQQLKECATG